MVIPPVEKLNRKGRRMYHIKTPGVQDPKEATLQVYYIPMKRKSKAGVEYTYYKKVVDVIGLDKKNDKDK